MIDLNNLIDFFPYYFKENDSYKVNGQGLLERFLNICGNYFQEYPVKDLDNFLEILDVNQTNVIFIQNFWKFFGELPFAQGPIIDGEIFTKTFTGFNFDEAIQQATRSTQPYTGKANLDYRALIKYSVSLFKIRGTQQFFEIMFRLYGLDIIIISPIDENPFLKDHTTRFDLEDTQFDKATLDNYYRCQNCLDVIFSLTIPEDLKTWTQSQLLPYVKQVKAFIERFVPFYINPIIRVAGQASLSQVTISVSTKEIDLNLDEKATVQVNVSPVVKDNPLVSLAYQVAVVGLDEIPTQEDWGLQEYTDPNYTIYLGNKSYWFRPVANTLGSSSVSVKVNERYTTSQYMIWIVSPLAAGDRILSSKKKTIEINVKAVENIYTYLNGVRTHVLTKNPAIHWDNTGQVFGNGTAKVTVDYYGTQTFSIQSYRSRKANIYIDATAEYKAELDVLILNLDPKYLLIKDNNFEPGTGSGTDISKLAPGIYASEDGAIWTSHKFETTFRVTNRDGVEQPQASVVDISNTFLKYKSGQSFIPFSRGAGSYTFRAILMDQVSEGVVLRVLSDSEQVLRPIFRSISVSPNPLTFQYSGAPSQRILGGELIIANLTQTAAQNYNPVVVMEDSRTGQEKQEINCTFKEYVGGLAKYSFTVTHKGGDTLESYQLTFYAKENPNLRDTVSVITVQPSEVLYISPNESQIAQWSGMDPDDSTKDIRLTFQAEPGKNIAKFTFEGTYSGEIVGPNGQIYFVADSEDDTIEIEVQGDQTLNFQTSTGITLTVILRDYPAVVTISCNPTKDTLTKTHRDVSTRVTGTTNKSELFRFKIDGEASIYVANPEYIFKTSDPGTHVFTALDDPTKEATFEVDSTINTGLQVSRNFLVWGPDETSERTIDIQVPDNVHVTITEENLPSPPIIEG